MAYFSSASPGFTLVAVVMPPQTAGVVLDVAFFVAAVRSAERGREAVVRREPLKQLGEPRGLGPLATNPRPVVEDAPTRDHPPPGKHGQQHACGGEASA